MDTEKQLVPVWALIIGTSIIITLSAYGFNKISTLDNRVTIIETRFLYIEKMLEKIDKKVSSIDKRLMDVEN